MTNTFFLVHDSSTELEDGVGSDTDADLIEVIERAIALHFVPTKEPAPGVKPETWPRLALVLGTYFKTYAPSAQIDPMACAAIIAWLSSDDCFMSDPCVSVALCGHDASVQAMAAALQIISHGDLGKLENWLRQLHTGNESLESLYKAFMGATEVYLVQNDIVGIQALELATQALQLLWAVQLTPEGVTKHTILSYPPTSADCPERGGLRLVKEDE